MNTIHDYNIAAHLLRECGVGIILTDTVYGLVARAADANAATRLYALKNRERKPGTVIASSVQQLIDFGLPKQELRIAERFWPGSVSVVVNLGDDFDYLHQGLGSVAFRVVSDEKVKKLLEITGPLVTTSANQPGMPVSNDIAEAFECFGDSVDFYLDGGRATNQLPSTIIRIADNKVVVLRDGAVKIDANL
jgi:tRNA threonylcarbamoyl adenosine modification protein (Sua5/YciO/YrdC/YwlC family)